MNQKTGTRPVSVLLLVLASVTLTLSVLELAARAWVHFRWSEREISILTEDLDARFGYVSDRETGYRLEPGRWASCSRPTNRLVADDCGDVANE